MILENKESELIMEDKNMQVFTIPLKHKITTNGFLFSEKASFKGNAAHMHFISCASFTNFSNFPKMSFPYSASPFFDFLFNLLFERFALKPFFTFCFRQQIINKQLDVFSLVLPFNANFGGVPPVAAPSMPVCP